MAAATAGLGIAVTVALVALWPTPTTSGQGQVIVGSESIRAAVVTGVEESVCLGESRAGCQKVAFRLDDGPTSGARSYLILPGDEATPRLSPGDRIRVTPAFTQLGPDSQVGFDPADPANAPYAFVDFRRGAALLWMVGLFALLVVVLGRRVGLVSLLGAGVGLALVTQFVAPAILAGSSPFLVALVGAFAAMFVSIVPLYGFGAKSLASLVSTAISIAVIALLAVLGVQAANITGIASEEATLVTSLGGGRLSLQGLVIAGILIGALGVLNDVTVTQSATVLALRRANPSWRARQLYSEAMVIGRDHLGATVNTLVFAYAGASLPLLVLFSAQSLSFGDVVGREVVATEIVAAIVGSIGLICAVPLSTMAATVLATRVPPSVLPDAVPHVH